MTTHLQAQILEGSKANPIVTADVRISSELLAPAHQYLVQTIAQALLDMDGIVAGTLHCREIKEPTLFEERE